MTNQPILRDQPRTKESTTGTVAPEVPKSVAIMEIALPSWRPVAQRGQSPQAFRRRARRSLQDFYGIRRHPNVDLVEACPHALFEVEEELATVVGVRRVDKRPYQIVTEEFVFVSPKSANRLGLARHSAKPLFEFEKGIGNQFVGNRLAVIKPSWEKDLETPK
jgi:hypothetical protein